MVLCVAQAWFHASIAFIASVMEKSSLPGHFLLGCVSRDLGDRSGVPSNLSPVP
jgi:hypothetical protein